MIGAGSIVARSLRRVIADEDGSRIIDMCQVFFIHCNVLGSDSVGEFQCLLMRFCQQDCSVFFERRLGDLILCGCKLYFGSDHFRQRVRGRDEYSQCVRVMFCLRHQISGDESWIAAFTQDYDFSWPSEKIYAAIESNKLFCGGHKEV